MPISTRRIVQIAGQQRNYPTIQLICPAIQFGELVADIGHPLDVITATRPRPIPIIPAVRGQRWRSRRNHRRVDP